MSRAYWAVIGEQPFEGVHSMHPITRWGGDASMRASTKPAGTATHGRFSAASSSACSESLSCHCAVPWPWSCCVLRALSHARPSSRNMFRRPAALEHPRTQRVGDRPARVRHSQREEAVRMHSGLPLQVDESKKCMCFCAIRFAANHISKRPRHAQSPPRHAVTQASPVPSL
jgi:hypothetical protein